MVMSICDNADVLSVLRVVKIVINIIKIVVPIMLMLFLMIDYMKAIKNNDADALSKTNQLAVKKVIAVLLIFFIPTFVGLIVNISGHNPESYTACLQGATRENINTILVSDAKVYLKKAQKSLKRGDYNVAVTSAAKIKDNSSKEAIFKELEELEKKISEKEKQEKEERERAAREAMEALTGTLTGTTTGGGGGGSRPISPGVSGSVDNVMGVVWYQQCDSRWKNIEYDIGGGPNNTHATVCSSACGYTSFAMIAAGLNKDLSINPYSVIKYMRNISDGQLTQRGYGAASWNEIAGNDMIKHYNLSATFISTSEIEANLKAGKPVIALVPGHYIVLSYSANGNVVLLDPFVGWANQYKKSGEFKSVRDIEAIYGSISRAAAYSKI